ncbi:MAG: hypothetical protein QNI91_14715, partial [Arenicellales bacterium]|nr:hypothetical protein [Arenicellales bacterium]
MTESVKPFCFLAHVLSWAVVFLFLTTALVACGEGTESTHDHTTHTHADTHTHDSIDVSSDADIPSLSLEIAPDAVGGWNVRIRTSEFRFTPENVNKEHVSGEGHAHLYVDGVKKARLYGEWFHLGDLSPGT